MPKEKVSADRLIAELNAAYVQEPGADLTNQFHPSPPQATGSGIRGYTTDALWTPQHQRAHNKVHDVFELDVGNE